MRKNVVLLRGPKYECLYIDGELIYKGYEVPASILLDALWVDSTIEVKIVRGKFVRNALSDDTENMNTFIGDDGEVFDLSDNKCVPVVSMDI